MANNGIRFRDGNPYARRPVPMWKLVMDALPFLRAQEVTPGPTRLKFKPRRVRTIPPILDERPIDIYRTVTEIYSVPYRIPRAYVATPEIVGQS